MNEKFHYIECLKCGQKKMRYVDKSEMLVCDNPYCSLHEGKHVKIANWKRSKYLWQKKLEVAEFESVKKPDYNKKPCITCKYLEACLDRLKPSDIHSRLCSKPFEDIKRRLTL